MTRGQPNPTLLGERELDLMQALWRAGSGTVAEVQARIPELAYTTVQTMLNRLQAKGYLRRDREGRAYRYRPLVKRPAAQQGAVRRVLRRFFDGSSEALAVHLVESGMETEELDRLGRLIRERRKR
jgi:BlaI family penicillinase repressor